MDSEMTFSELCNRLVRLASSPWMILFSAIFGALCGICFPDFSQKLSLGGEIYLNYITLLTIPLMVCALSSSLASLLQQNRNKQRTISIKKMFVLLLFMYLLIGILGTVSEVAVNRFLPHQLNVEYLDELLHAKKGDQTDYIIRIYEPPKEKIQKQFSFQEFVLESIPTNIFKSLSQGDALHILIFSILFGLALGMLPPKQSQSMITGLSSTYQACLLLIQYSAYALPVFLFCLLSNKISLMDYFMLKMVSQFLLVLLVLEALLSVAGLVIWSRTLRMPIRTLLKNTGKTMLIAIGTCQTFVAMPSLMQDMEEKMHYSPEQLKLVVPFAVTMGKFSRILGLTVTAVFVSYLYYGEVAWFTIPILLVIAPLFSIGGAWPIVATALLKILGLPGELGLLLLLAVNPFLEPISTLCNIIHNGLFSSLIIKRNAPGCECK